MSLCSASRASVYLYFQMGQPEEESNAITPGPMGPPQWCRPNGVLWSPAFHLTHWAGRCPGWPRPEGSACALGLIAGGCFSS